MSQMQEFLYDFTGKVIEIKREQLGISKGIIKNKKEVFKMHPTPSFRPSSSMPLHVRAYPNMPIPVPSPSQRRQKIIKSRGVVLPPSFYEKKVSRGSPLSYQQSIVKPPPPKPKKLKITKRKIMKQLIPAPMKYPSPIKREVSSIVGGGIGEKGEATEFLAPPLPPPKFRSKNYEKIMGQKEMFEKQEEEFAKVKAQENPELKKFSSEDELEKIQTYLTPDNKTVEIVAEQKIKINNSDINLTFDTEQVNNLIKKLAQKTNKKFENLLITDYGGFKISGFYSKEGIPRVLFSK